MTSANFQHQIKRLKDQWPNSYGVERVGVLWRAFEKTNDSDFGEAVTECLANHRAAPLVQDIATEVTAAQTRRIESERRDYQILGQGEAVDILAAAARKTTNKEFAAACMKALNQKLKGEISSDQFFNEVCPLLDEAAKQLNGGTECARCGNSGYTFKEIKDGYRELWRCKCALGSMKPEVAYGAMRADGTRIEARAPQEGRHV